MRPSIVRLAVLLVILAVVTAIAVYGDRDKNAPGAFDYYLLVLGWSPAYCASEGRDRGDRQCDTSQARSFILHGLWPQNEQGWPKDCATGDRIWVPRAVIDAMLPVMPSKGLIIHEYRAHGTCSGLDPVQYFDVARELYDRVTIPARFADPAAWMTTSPDAIERDFVASNAWLKPEMMAVACRGQELLDIRFCFGRDLLPRRCGANEDQKRLCRRDTLTLRPPAQSGR